MNRQHCNAIGCRLRIRRDDVFCARHLAMAESDTRTVLGRTFRPEKRSQSLVFEETLDRARLEILYFATEGHRMPRDVPFQWDDDKAEML